MQISSDVSSNHGQEVASGERFEFGANWQRFLNSLTDQRVTDADESLKAMLLDIGSGSGLFSLSARRLGAKVVSFDYDSQSVCCTAELKRRHFPSDNGWEVQHGSVLDAAYMQGLGRFDVVYSWGVLHHTGAMWEAIENSMAAVSPGGTVFVALYNDQGTASKYWAFVKRTYNKRRWTRPFWIALHTLYPLLPSMALRAVRGRKLRRGMNPWTDLLDWLGGYPFEVSTPAEVKGFFESRGFRLKKAKEVGRRLGCNEFVFERTQ
jgi:SAM-dependent methyltransferase